MAAQQNVRLTRANAAGALALYYNMKNNESKAEMFAQEAVDYGETLGNGSKVLQIIAGRREAMRQRLKEARRRQEEARRRQEEERRRQEEERRRQEEVRRQQEEEELRRQEEARRQQEEKRRRAEEARKRYEEQEREKERKTRERDAAIAKRRNFYIIGWLVWIGELISFEFLERFMTVPLFLIFSIIGTTVPAYTEAAYLGERGTLGDCYIFIIILYSVYTKNVDGISFFTLFIILIVFQIISWMIGKRQKIS